MKVKWLSLLCVGFLIGIIIDPAAGRQTPCIHCPVVEIEIVNHAAKPVPPRVTVRANSKHHEVGWRSVDDRKFTVTFEQRTPCQRQSFDNQHPVCEVNAPPGRYFYTATLAGVPQPGRGEITVR